MSHGRGGLGIAGVVVRGVPSALQEFGRIEQMVPSVVAMCALFADACSKLQV